MNTLQLLDQARALGLPADGFLLVADSTRQQLQVLEDGVERAVFPISTSRLGLGNREGSHQTPPGMHRVAERIGDKAAPGSVFKSRIPTGEVLDSEGFNQDGDADLILTRILWLEGLEPGINSGEGIDSHERYIYLHGTNQEHRLGQAASHGCIRMANADIIMLHEWLGDREAWCWIGALDIQES